VTWSAPMTAVAGSVFTAAQFNTYVRDLFNETAPAKATAAGQIFVATGVNAIAARTPGANYIATSQTTASTAYVALATVGPTVTATTGTSALVAISAGTSNSGSGFSLMGYNISGASTIAAGDERAIGTGAFGGAIFLQTGLTPGSNTFTAVYRVQSGTGTFSTRNLMVVPL
jgi:hypothetical protein